MTRALTRAPRIMLRSLGALRSFHMHEAPDMESGHFVLVFLIAAQIPVAATIYSDGVTRLMQISKI